MKKSLTTVGFFPLLFYALSHKSSDPQSILRPLCRKSYALDNALHSKISWYFSAVMTRQKSATIRKWLPKNMPSWGKVRIAGGGDRICTAAGRNLDRERNMSYVRVSLLIDQITSVYLKNFIVRGGSSGCHQQCRAWNLLWTTGPNSRIRHPDQQFWGLQFRGKTVLLVIITPCVTLGKDATKTLTTYSQTMTQIVTDLRTISSVIGRVWTRNRWGIIDRSEETSRTEFIPSNMEVFDLAGGGVTD